MVKMVIYVTHIFFKLKNTMSQNNNLNLCLKKTKKEKQTKCKSGRKTGNNNYHIRNK